TQKILLSGNIEDEVEDYLVWLVHQSNNLYNSALYAVRQAHFDRGGCSWSRSISNHGVDQCESYTFFDENEQYRIAFKDRFVKASYGGLCQEFKTNVHYKALGGQQAQQCLKSVVEGITSYNQLLKGWWNKEILDRPRMPRYRKKRGVYQVTFPNQAVGYDDVTGICRLAISSHNKSELVNKEILITGGYGFSTEQLAEVRIVPSNGQLWAEYVYKIPALKASSLDYSQALGIDPGVTNWLTCVSTQGKSFIVCGKKIKSINQRYNKTIAKYKTGKSDSYWDEYLDKITHKRNCQIRDSVHKAARFVINYCAIHGIGNIVFGWGQGVKTESNLGKVNNQNFVQIPTAKLKNRIKELAESVGIVFTETEEAYTSKSDFLAGDLLFKFGEKPKEYKFSGRRITRGMYRSQQGWLISADAHGAANILKKVAIQLKLSLAEVSKETLTVPKRYDLSIMKKSYRKRGENRLLDILEASA
ncbi:MAG: RNA-guided endonuclease InsQ/TnpB family protein, partial [Xenococcus sp. (in: cyanobacteria)]